MERSIRPYSVLAHASPGWNLTVTGKDFSRLHRDVPSSQSLVFCCYQQVYDIFNTSCLRVILQVRGRDGMSTPQNGVAAYS